MRHTISLIMMLLLLGGCSQDTSLTPVTPGAGEAVPLQVDDIVLEKSVETRAAASLTTDGDSIGIFCSKETGYDAAQANIPYVYSAAAAKWAPAEASKPVWLLAGNANVCAYYPYAPTYTDNTAIPLAAGVYGDSAVVDLCFAPNRAMNGTPTKSKTRFAMQRAMAMMRFTLKRGNFPGTCRVSDITLRNDNLPATGTINITAAANTAVAVKKADLFYTPAAVTDGADGSVTPTADGVPVRDVLLVPFAPSGNFSVILTVDGKNMKLDLAPATFAGSKIEAGKRYLLTLKLNATALQVTDVTIEDWVDFAMTDTGGKDYEPFPKPKPEHAIEIDGLDFYVADGNVRAIKQADNTYKYDFAGEQGYYSGVTGQAYDLAGGDYFCWNTLDPNQLKVTQSSWDDARDPCRQIGDGQWQTPTQDQIKKFGELYTAGKAVWGTYTMKDGTTKKYGWYFGTETKDPIAKADQDKYVFLPAAGYRDIDSAGTIFNEGSSGTGYYWSSTPDASRAYNLGFNSSYVNDGSSSNSRYYGCSLRCVRNK